MGFIGDFLGATKPISFRQGEDVQGVIALLNRNNIRVDGFDSINGDSVISVSAKDYSKAVLLVNRYLLKGG